MFTSMRAYGCQNNCTLSCSELAIYQVLIWRLDSHCQIAISLYAQYISNTSRRIIVMTQNKPMGEILKRMELMEFLEIIIFDETMILNDPIDSWPICDCLISFHSKGSALFF